jgi:hypothetical protein
MAMQREREMGGRVFNPPGNYGRPVSVLFIQFWEVLQKFGSNF